MILLRYFLISVLVCLLTVVTQVGGLVLLISLTTYRFIDRRWESMWKRMTAKSLCFAILYLVFVFIIVPLAAKPLGRVPLPIVEDRNLKPGNVWTCLLNRNYVRPQLRDITYKVAEDLKHKYPGATLSYLDANFPFIEKFPLFPHRSHNDGRKLDLSFQYNESGTGRITNDIPSPIGYGICEEPAEGEEDKPLYCSERGYWQYNLLRDIVPQRSKRDFTFDGNRTKAIVEGFAAQEALGKIFIEPHLKTRLGLTSSKIRFHGCQAVRHDDHIHVQLK